MEKFQKLAEDTTLENAVIELYFNFPEVLKNQVNPRLLDELTSTDEEERMDAYYQISEETLFNVNGKFYDICEYKNAIYLLARPHVLSEFIAIEGMD